MDLRSPSYVFFIVHRNCFLLELSPMQTNKIYVGLIAGIVTLLSGGYIVYRNILHLPTVSENDTGVATTSVSSLSTTTKETGTARIKKENVPVVTIIIPDLNRFVVASSISEQNRLAFITQMQKLSSALKADPTKYPDWLELAAYRREAGDYDGARIVLEYQTMVWSNQYVPHYNLATLFHYYVKDSKKAEDEYRRALVIRGSGPESIGTYLELHRLYANVYKEKQSLADDVLIEGLQKNPNDISLLWTLASFYKDTGVTTDARIRFETLLSIAHATGDSQLEARVTSELATLH